MSTFSARVLPRDRRLCSQSGRRSRLDRGHDSTDEGMEGSIVLREKISSPQNFGHGGKGSSARSFFLWRKRLLPRRFTRLGIVSCSLSDDEGTYPDGRPRSAHWLLLGCNAADQARCDAGANALSSAGTDEKVKGDFRYPSKIQEGG